MNYRQLNLAKKEIICGGCDEEKPRELCKIARGFFKIERKDKFKETIKEALKILKEIKEKNPWKFTNYLCYVAYELTNSEKENILVKKILNEAIGSLDKIDEYYLKRKKEIQSYLKEFSKNKNIPKKSFEENINSLFLFIYLDKEKIKEIKSVVKKNSNEKEIFKVVSNIDQLWRQTVALCITARLFLEKLDFSKSLKLLNIALKQARKIRFYWVRDNAFEVISGTFLEVYHKKNESYFLNIAKSITNYIEDPWKKAKSICHIIKTEIREKNFKQVAEGINYINSNLFNKINYSDRKAMSILLISEVLNKIGKKDEANKFQKNALSILNHFNHNKRRNSLKEYEEFISLITIH